MTYWSLDDQGRIVAQGTFQEVIQNPAMASLLAEFNSTGESTDRRPGAQLIDDPTHSPGSDADVDSETPEVPSFLPRLPDFQTAAALSRGDVGFFGSALILLAIIQISVHSCEHIQTVWRIFLPPWENPLLI